MFVAAFQDSIAFSSFFGGIKVNLLDSGGDAGRRSARAGCCRRVTTNGEVGDLSRQDDPVVTGPPGFLSR